MRRHPANVGHQIPYKYWMRKWAAVHVSVNIYAIHVYNIIFLLVKKEMQAIKSQLGFCKEQFASCKKLEDQAAVVMFECRNPTTTNESNQVLPAVLSELDNTELEQQKKNLIM